jgi:hypothetical protein
LNESRLDCLRWARAAFLSALLSLALPFRFAPVDFAMPTG